MSKTPIGNVKGFAGELMQHIIYTIGLGYMGGSISAMAKLSNEDLKNLFPHDTDKLPYKSDNFTKRSVHEALKNGVWEYVWPMKSLGFPYNKRMKENGQVIPAYVNWLIDTCAGVFSTFRIYYHDLVSVEKWLTESSVGRIVVFFVMPYLLIYVAFSPLIPFIGFFTAVLCSMFEEANGFMFTFSPITAWFYGIGQCKEINLGCLFSYMITGIIGLFLPMNYIPWWIGISFAVWLYTVIVLLFSPFLYKNGLQQVFREILKQKVGLTLVFIYLTLKTSMSFLIPPAVLGLVLGTFYVLYELLFKKNK